MSLRAALRSSITDFYFNSWRLAPANVAWGAILVLAMVAGIGSLVGLALLAALAVPTAGLYRMAALLARGNPVAFTDFVDGMRRYALPALGVAAAAGLLALVLTTNLIVGLDAAHPIGWFISAMALWGEVALVMLLVAFWPVLVDPVREGVPLRRRLALAGLAVVGRPGRLLALTAVVVALLLLSTVLFALVATVSVAYVSLVSARYVLPLVDELEARLREAHQAR